MLRLRPRSTRTDTRCPYSTPCRSEGADAARPAPGVMAAIGEADHVVVAPSNPIVSIGPLLAVEGIRDALVRRRPRVVAVSPIVDGRSEEHTSELQSLMRISYAVFCLKKKTTSLQSRT